jgi:hypothetical protein
MERRKLLLAGATAVAGAMASNALTSNALTSNALALVGRFLGSNRMLAGTEVVKCPCEMRAWSLSTKVLL